MKIFLIKRFHAKGKIQRNTKQSSFRINNNNNNNKANKKVIFLSFFMSKLQSQ